MYQGSFVKDLTQDKTDLTNQNKQLMLASPNNNSTAQTKTTNDDADEASLQKEIAEQQ